MSRASKQTRSSATKHPETQPSASVDANNPELSSDSDSNHHQLVLAFKTGPRLEQVPDDVLLEILSHLPTVNVKHGGHLDPLVLASEMLTRTSTTRALSQTCRLLRSRCLAMAWKRIDICGVGPTRHGRSFVIVKVLTANMSVLADCPYLRPLIQTVTAVLMADVVAELLPAFAECLASLPNVTLVKIVHVRRPMVARKTAVPGLLASIIAQAQSQMATDIKKAFKGQRFPSVRKMVLPSCAHEMLRCCPNVEEVTCNEGNGSKIVGAIVKGNCKKVQVLIGISAPLTRLVRFLPNLKHTSVEGSSYLMDIDSLARFPLLTTIEIIMSSGFSKEEAVTAATKVLKANKSEENKFIKLTHDYLSTETTIKL
ncbi:hypothetical protein BU15DRAFT_74773 [Melanogaster broomeanus]|nr:hypothetical protein BU15DRAFT_74773 [Melanogaster broomeanus]